MLPISNTSSRVSASITQTSSYAVRKNRLATLPENLARIASSSALSSSTVIASARSAQRGGGDARRNYDTGAVHDYKEVKDDNGVKVPPTKGSMFNHLSSALVLYLFIGPT